MRPGNDRRGGSYQTGVCWRGCIAAIATLLPFKIGFAVRELPYIHWSVASPVPEQKSVSNEQIC
jgi:hypothetical protein